MKVLVTGACGFLGSHVCEHFAREGWEVVGLDNMTTYELEKTGFKDLDVRVHMEEFVKKQGVELKVGSVEDLDRLLYISHECDYLVNCAAQPAMTLAIEDPFLDFGVNVLGGLNVLEVGKIRSIPVALCSTIHVYGNWINDELVEEDKRYRMGPGLDEDNLDMVGVITPLHASKKSMEVYGQAYIDTYGTKVGIFRLSGMYGPRQFGGEDHGWVANFTIRTVLGRPITIFGSGRQTRDILYATDASRLFEAFYQNPKPGLYTVGGGEDCAISLIECLEKLKGITGEEQNIEFKDERLGDLRWFVSSNEKVKGLGWEPRVLPQEGLGKLVEWARGVKEML